MVSFLSSKSRKVKDERGGGAHKSAAPLHARAMTATSNPPAELPALGAGCEGDFVVFLVPLLFGCCADTNAQINGSFLCA